MVPGNIKQYVDELMRRSKALNERTGQALHKSLPVDIRRWVNGALFDPFYKDLSEEEIYQWIDNHLIFDDEGVLIGLYDRNTILWERETT